jgi:hypothetical protein
MATAYTSLLRLAQPVPGELDGTWGSVVNDNITAMVEEAVAGAATIDTWVADSATLSTADGSTDQSRVAILLLTDTTVDLTGAGELICPTSTKVYVVKNDTGQIITIKTSAGTGIAIGDGSSVSVFCDGTNVENTLAAASTTVSGTVILATGVETNTGTDATKAVTPDAIEDWEGSAQVTTLGTITSGVWTGTEIGSGYLPATEVSEDTTPVLGGDLTVGGNSIISASNGDIAITPNGTGDVILDGLKWPQADGTTDYVLKTDGAGQLSWVAEAAGGIASVAADGSPQLGGDLDIVTYSIISTSNGDIAVTPNGTGDIILDGLKWPQADGTADYVLKTDGAGQLSWVAEAAGGISSVLADATPQLGGSFDVNGHSIVSAVSSNADVSITPDGSGDLILDGQKWPQADGTANQLIKTNGSGQLAWTSGITVTTITASGTVTGPSGTWNSGGMDIASGDTYEIDGTTVLSATTLGANVVNSSLTGFVKTASASTKTSGTLTFNDSVICAFGTGSDMQVYCDGAHGYIDLGSGIGNLIIRDGTTTRFTFNDNGDFTATGNVTAYSDIRVKNNIEVIPNALNKVMSLNGYTFDRTDIDVPRQTGVIAQEVLEVLPEAVNSEGDKMSVAYGNMVGLLIEAIKEQQIQIEELKNGNNSN